MRKLFLLGLVVVVALVVLKRTELGRLVRVWWHGTQTDIAAAIPVETRIDQLKLTISDAEKQFTALRNKQSKLEVAAEVVKDELKTLTAAQEKRAGAMEALIAALEGEGDKVALDGKTYAASELQNRLDRLTRDHTYHATFIESRAALLVERQRLVEASERQRRQALKKIDDLRLLVVKLETRLASLRGTQTAGTSRLDNDLGEAQRLVELVDVALREGEKLEEIKARDGLLSAQPDTTTPTRTESVQAARQALAGK